MIMAGFLFTLLIVYIVCRLIGKEPYMAKEKPIWKKLIYWAGILFISITFNILLYSSSNYSYKLSIELNDEGVYIFIWLILSYLLIQLLSPSMFLGRLFKNVITALTHKGTANNGNLPHSESVTSLKQTAVKKSFEEKDFELFLNTLCRLSFSFVIFINLFFIAANSVFAISPYIQDKLSQYGNTQDQLNFISRIMVFLTLPIAFRQILFYLSKLKKSSADTNGISNHDSLRYERYMLVQKRLKNAHRRL